MSEPAAQGGPYFVPPFEGRVGGVDFLGLRQANLDMMNEIFPGISNSTLHIRPFSILSWIIWRFEQEAAAKKRRRVTSADFRIFLEKAEVLFTWGHQLAGISVPGANSKCPAESGPVPLTFHDWNRRASNTSLNCALQYGPGMKARNGFSFAEVVRPGVYNVTDRGEALAREFDKRVQRSSGIPILTDLEPRNGRKRDAEDLLDVWCIDAPSAPERRLFLESFYDPATVGGETRTAERSSGIKALLEVVRQSGGRLTEAGIRHGLARMRKPNGGRLELSAPLEGVARRWLALQIRQAQRAALETYLTWFEAQIVIEAKSLAELEGLIPAGLLEHQESNGGAIRCGDYLKRLDELDASEADYHRACARGSPRCFFRMTEDILGAAQATPGAVIPAVTSLLVRTIHLTRWVSSDERVHHFLALGGAGRVSLNHQAEHFGRFADETLVAWMADILQRWVIGQHLSVATLRFTGQKQRLRFGLCEDGFEFYAAKLSQPNLSRDHLRAALSLITESGLLERSGEFFCSV